MGGFAGDQKLQSQGKQLLNITEDPVMLPDFPLCRGLEQSMLLF